MTETKNTRLRKQVMTLGLVIVLGAGYFLAQNLTMIFSDIKTTATVMKVEQVFQHAGDTTRAYIPTVRYTTNTGRVVTMSTGYGSSMYDFDVGEEITVYYDKQKPSSFNIVVPLSTWALPIIGLLVGCLILWSARRL